MNALIRKETRLLLPAWIAALVAATTPLWPLGVLRGMAPVFCGAAILGLALMPFGQETSYGTFGLLLVQPEERRRFWRIKAGLLAMAMASAWVVFALCIWIHPTDARADGNDLPELLKISALITFLAFSGGLWSTLLLRDMVSAFFCTLIVPVAICGVTALAVSHWVDFDKGERTLLYTSTVCWVLVMYAVAGFLWAWRLFLTAQDVPWTGGQISLSSVRGMSLRWLAFEFKGRQNRWTALVKKELQLQEVTMVLIPLLALLHLAIMTLCHFHPKWPFKDGIAAVVPILWLGSVPFVIGCVAVAEERRFNIMESLLCLPVSKRASFAVKLAVALVLGIVLGGVIPLALIRINGAFFDLKFQNFAEVKFLNVMEIAAAVTGVAFYASTLSRGLLQAVPAALGAYMLGLAILGLYMKLLLALGNHLEFVQSMICPTLVLPTMISILVWLAFRNYKRLQIGWRVWAGDFTRIGAVFGCVVLANIAIFDRTWELFMPLEPSHGPARISGLGRADIGVSKEAVCVLLLDGRLWIGKNLWTTKYIAHRKAGRILKGISGGFANGTNWVKMAVNHTGAIALQSDGTLWKVPNKSDITQIGSDSDWQEISAGGSTFMAVKQDGTLWGWGIDYDNILVENSYQNKKGVLVADPVQIGKDADWVNVFMIENSLHVIGVKRDGTVWRWGLKLGHTYEAYSIRQKIRDKMEGSDWMAMSALGQTTFGIRTDGSLWVVGNLPENVDVFGEKVRPGTYEKPVRVGAKSDWVSISGQWQETAFEANGTLLTMEWFPEDQTKRPSKYTDWLAATEDYPGSWAVAKDGTLTCWNEFGIDRPEDGATFLQKFFLGPTRRPVFSINILGKQQ